MHGASGEDGRYGECEAEGEVDRIDVAEGHLPPFIVPRGVARMLDVMPVGSEYGASHQLGEGGELVHARLGEPMAELSAQRVACGLQHQLSPVGVKVLEISGSRGVGALLLDHLDEITPTFIPVEHSSDSSKNKLRVVHRRAFP